MLCFCTSKLRNFWTISKNKCRSDLTEVLYILFRKCAARIVCPHMHTLRLFIYTSTWVFTLSVFNSGFPKTLKWNRQK